VRGMQRTWATLKPRVDEQRYHDVASFLEIQEEEAEWWRDASIAYFQTLSKRPLPQGHAAPPHDLEHYKAIETPYAPGNGR
jgi:alpha-glucuronidase